MKYENNWESINSRPVPTWFEDAKFGIFIHWGIYSVPAFSGKTAFSEWYWHQLINGEQPTTDFHNNTYGEKFKYEDFAPMFKAELFDAKHWVELFEQAGARYINLVSKHHDGYCMYKSDYAWNWNSVDIGPHRDFCAELKEACENTSVRFGVYHSVYEWYNPLYKKDPEEYSVKHLLPMLKELICKYEPATLFTDGEWDHESSVWHSTEFLQWLYNESPVKDIIVPNDRWGKETRGRLGGNFTSEYGKIDGDRVIDDIELDRPFEECRGIGGSFAFNRNEDSDNYLTAKQLIDMFVDLVSKGGNFLLNIGPAADGTIPAIMQERLRQIGAWLKVNGEGIYASRKYKTSTQEGVVYTKRENKVYAFLKSFPFGSLTLNDVEFSEGCSARLLGSKTAIVCENDGGCLKLVFPPLNPDELESEYVYCFELSNVF